MQRDTKGWAPQGTGPDLAKLAVVYPRQSTQEQVRENVQSTARQLALREQAIAHGFPPERVLVITDDLGLSGRTIAGRPGFSRLLAMMAEGLVGALYVEDLTRLTRDERTVDHMIIASECEAAGVPLWMGGTWYDLGESGSRQAFKYQAVGFSETWRAHLAKVEAARRSKASQGRLAGATAPRGYRPRRDVPKNHPDRDRFTIHEPEAEVIRALAEAALEHGGIRAGWRAIAPVRWPDGKPVTYRVYVDALQHPAYRGRYVYGPIEVPNAHPAILSPEVAAQLDQLRELNRATARRPAPEHGAGGALSGLLVCGPCGRTAYTEASRRLRAYSCRNSKANPLRPKETCWHVHAQLLDDLVLDRLWAQLASGLASRVLANLGEERALAARSTNLGEGTRKALGRRIEGLVGSLADPDLDPAARRPLAAALAEAQRELEGLEAAALAAAKPHLAPEAAWFGELAHALAADPAMVATLAGTWDAEPIAWRRAWVRRFVLGVTLEAPASGSYQLTVTWRDGSREALALRTWVKHTEAEMSIIREALADPACPPKRGFAVFAHARLTAAGFERTVGAVRRMANELRHPDAPPPPPRKRGRR